MSEKVPFKELIPLAEIQTETFSGDFESDKEKELQNEDYDIFEKIAEIQLEKKYEATALPAMKLHLYNYLIKKPYCTYSDIKAELRKFQRISDVEREYSDVGNPLPTIGIEIEGPQVHFTPRKLDLLDQFQIPNSAQPVRDGIVSVPLWEVSSDFSYSARVQAQMLHELIDFQIIPRREDRTINSDTPLSLHINFAVPDAISQKDMRMNSESVEILNDVLTYAFTSSDRIQRKKTPETYEITCVRVRESKKGDSTNRIELRTPEFKDALSYKQLFIAQHLAAAMFSSVKYKTKKTLTFIEAKLADIWQEFEKEASHYLEVESMIPDNVAQDKEHVVRALHTTDLKYWSRFLAEEYSKKVSVALKELDIVSAEPEEIMVEEEK